MHDPLETLRALGARSRQEPLPSIDVRDDVLHRLRQPVATEVPIRPLAACACLAGMVTIVTVAALQWWQPSTPSDGLDAFFQVAAAQELWRGHE